MGGRAVFLGILTGLWLGAGALVHATAPEAAARVIEVEGTALIVEGDTPGARRAAIHQALREAIERTVGVHVNTSLHTRNYIAQEDRIDTQGAGFAVIDSILEEGTRGNTYYVKLRARVTAQPAATPATGQRWRVAAVLASPGTTYYGYVHAGNQTVETALTDRLEAAGFAAVDWRETSPRTAAAEAAKLARATPTELADWGRAQEVDLVISGEVSFEATRGLPASPEWLPVDYTRCQASATMRAVRVESGAVIAQETLREQSEATTREEAIRLALERLGKRLGDRLSAALTQLPGAATRERQVSLAGFASATEAERFPQMLTHLPGVRRVTRRDFVGGTLRLDTLIDPALSERLAALLEQWPALAEFHVQVHSDAGSQISGRVVPGR